MVYKIGANIRRYREMRSLSQKEFAKAIGVSGSRLSNWEQGINRPDVDTLALICKVLQVSPSELLDLDIEVDSLSDIERRLVREYRRRTDLQKAVNILLGLND
ncbi:helix-turn-helix transcriptional regulator [bacterium]|nr:helix-turn-helix transcriptional regulator [bacterium]